MYDMEDFGDTVSTIPGIVDMGKLVRSSIMASKRIVSRVTSVSVRGGGIV